MSRSRLAMTMVVGTMIINGWAVPARAALTCYGRAATIIGTDGKDTLMGTGRADVIAGLSGRDTIKCGTESWTIPRDWSS